MSARPIGIPTPRPIDRFLLSLFDVGAEVSGGVDSLAAVAELPEDAILDGDAVLEDAVLLLASVGGLNI